MSLVGITFAASNLVKNDRTPNDVLAVLVEEVGELATEISIERGFKNREPSADGIVGEAVDVILAALDIIKIHEPGITEKELNSIALSKCNKWLSLYEHCNVARQTFDEGFNCVNCEHEECIS